MGWGHCMLSLYVENYTRKSIKTELVPFPEPHKIFLSILNILQVLYFSYTYVYINEIIKDKYEYTCVLIV